MLTTLARFYESAWVKAEQCMLLTKYIYRGKARNNNCNHLININDHWIVFYRGLKTQGPGKSFQFEIHATCLKFQCFLSRSSYVSVFCHIIHTLYIYYIIPMYSTLIYNTLVIEISNAGIFCEANHGNIRVDTSRTSYTLKSFFVNCVGDGSGSRRLSLDRCRYGLEGQHAGQFLVRRPKALRHFILSLLRKSSSRWSDAYRDVVWQARWHDTTLRSTNQQNHRTNKQPLHPGALAVTRRLIHHLTLTRVHSVCGTPIANSHSQRYPEKARVSLSQRLSPLPPPHMSP